jgi:putative Ca2+/H+ antiporter (TMEM165/GDT1 family)
MADWGEILSTFGLVFVAELGDKTQLAVVTQTCRFRRPWAVFLGASVALVVVTALGAAGGRVLYQFVPPLVTRVLSAALFVAMGVLIWWRSRRPRFRDDDEVDEACAVTCDPETETLGRRLWDWRAFGSTLSLLFVAELGDKTQLAVLGLTCKQPTAWGVFAGGALALVTVTALGVLGGAQLRKLVPERMLLSVSAVAFVVMGGLMGMGIL